MPLVLDSLVVETPFEVRSWLDTGMDWKPGERHPESGRVYVQDRPALPTLVALHATGADRPNEYDPPRVFENLTLRGYSVEFCLGEDGVLYQFADPVRHHCLHVGGLNKRAVGIECVNHLRPRKGSGRPPSESIVQVCGIVPKNYPRDFVVGRDKRRRYYWRSGRLVADGLYPAQLETLRGLSLVLEERLGIPRRRSDERDYVPVGERGELPAGWLLHSQVTLRHGDPSLDSFDALL